MAKLAAAAAVSAVANAGVGAVEGVASVDSKEMG